MIEDSYDENKITDENCLTDVKDSLPPINTDGNDMFNVINEGNSDENKTIDENCISEVLTILRQSNNVNGDIRNDCCTEEKENRSILTPCHYCKMKHCYLKISEKKRKEKYIKYIDR